MRLNLKFFISLSCVITCCVFFELSVRADDSVARPERSTIEKGLKFLQQDAVKWRQDKKCSTCHHGTMTMWVQLETKSRGFAVKPDELQENIHWAKERIMERADLPRDTRPGWSMVNTPAIYLAIMAHAVPQQDAISPDDLKRVSGHLLRHQEENGAWMWSSAPPKNVPPPFFESDEVATRLAYLALAPQIESGADDTQAIKASLARADGWLRVQTATDTTQAAVLRLLMKQQADAPVDDLKQRIDGLLSQQHSDGGWSQIKGTASDAYATGQVLYALNLAGVSPESDGVANAVTFPVRTQRDDGSWPMTKRTHPGETPTQNVIPITYFGSAWATLGLLRSVPCETTREP